MFGLAANLSVPGFLLSPESCRAATLPTTDGFVGFQSQAARVAQRVAHTPASASPGFCISCRCKHES